MAIICPTILAITPRQYQRQLLRVEGLSERLQIDFADATLSSRRTVTLEQLYWPPTKMVDLHLMTKYPGKYRDTVLAIRPHLVILHQISFRQARVLSSFWRTSGIRFGLAITGYDQLKTLAGSYDWLDHIMIYSGSLGKFGGTCDLAKLVWVSELRKMKMNLEIGWDGGITSDNIVQLRDGGVDVLNVGGFIQKASKPANAYAILKSRLQR